MKIMHNGNHVHIFSNMITLTEIKFTDRKSKKGIDCKRMKIKYEAATPWSKIPKAE